MFTGLLLDGQATQCHQDKTDWLIKITNQFSNATFKRVLVNSLNDPVNLLAKQILVARAAHVPSPFFMDWVACASFSKLRGQGSPELELSIYCCYNQIDSVFESNNMTRVYPRARWVRNDELYFVLPIGCNEITENNVDILMEYYDEEHHSVLIHEDFPLIKMSCRVDLRYLENIKK